MTFAVRVLPCIALVVLAATAGLVTPSLGAAPVGPDDAGDLPSTAAAESAATAIGPGEGCPTGTLITREAAPFDVAALPVPTFQTCTGRIRPGALMTAPAGCTYNFVFTDGASTYIGTAGHCTSSVGQSVSASGVGPFGSVVYRINSGGADDFSLIRIQTDKLGLVDATMCSWGGPDGVATGGITPGEVLLEYGWGVATQFHAATRTRAHSGFSASASSTVTWNGVGSGGDSGAPITTSDGEALGIHTFGVTPVAGVVLEGGPHIQHILALVRGAGFNVSVVTV